MGLPLGERGRPEAREASGRRQALRSAFASAFSPEGNGVQTGTATDGGQGLSKIAWEHLTTRNEMKFSLAFQLYKI